MSAARFLALLGGRFTFQTFDDSPQHRKPLARILHGTLAEHADTLADLNARGAGVFVMVNEGDGKGRTAANVQRVRALFVDLDGASLEPVQAATPQPHCIVESSPGRWHAYWRVSDCSLEKYKPMQQALAARFSGDASVCDLPRVMRLPGFEHRKREPFLSHIVALCDRGPYTVAELVQAFDLQPPTPQPKAKRKPPDVIPVGERNATLLSFGAGFVRRGFGEQAVNDRLQRMNAERCTPPLCATEVDAIAARAIRYGSQGYRFLADALFDALARSGLPLPVRWIVLTALRRFDGFNNGNIALTWQDCKDIPGCKDESSFRRHRTQAAASGFLIVAQEPKLTRDGRTPTLYAIPSQYLPSLTGQNTPLAHTGRNTPSYIDKQSLPALAPPLVRNGRKTPKAA